MPMSGFAMMILVGAAMLVLMGTLIVIFAFITNRSAKQRGQANSGGRVAMAIGLAFVLIGAIGIVAHRLMEAEVSDATVILKVEPQDGADDWGSWIEKSYLYTESSSEKQKGYLFEASAVMAEGYARSRTGSLADRTSFVIVEDEDDEAVLFVLHGSKRVYADGSELVLTGGIPAPSANNKIDPGKYEAVVFATEETLAESGVGVDAAVAAADSGLPESADEFQDAGSKTVERGWANPYI